MVPGNHLIRVLGEDVHAAEFLQELGPEEDRHRREKGQQNTQNDCQSEHLCSPICSTAPMQSEQSIIAENRLFVNAY